MNLLNKKKILLGVCGSIAAYKSAELLRLLTKAGAEVKVVMTANAQKFISTLTFQALSGHPVYSDQFSQSSLDAMAHIELARWADCILVAPASANFIANIAHGFANDLLSSLCLAANVPILIAPAMNQGMWNNRLTQDNIQKLKSAFISVLPVESGIQACKEEGEGCLLSPEEIVNFLSQKLDITPQSNKCSVLLTAGPTHEPIDPVRFIGNYSSGKMGYTLAQAFVQAGHPVTLISGPCAIAAPPVTQFISVKTAEEMQQAVKQHISKADIFISVAAVADYRIKNPQTEKIKKNAAEIQIELIQNSDILAEVAALPQKPFVVGFAAETQNIFENAQEKLKKKNLDMIILNPISQTSPFNADYNEVWVFNKNQNSPLHIPQMLKEFLSLKLRDLILESYKTK